MSKHIAILIAVLMTANAAWGQDQAAEQAQAESPQTQTPSSPANAEIDQQERIATAYQQEFAFLESQRRQLEQLVAQTKARQQAARSALQQEVDQLQRQVVRLDARADEIDSELNRSIEQVQVNEDNSEVLAATFQQGGATLEQAGIEALKSDEFMAQDDASKISTLFQLGQNLLARLSSVRTEQAEFFTPEGKEVTGEVLYVGNVAAYGRGADVSGVLAPAGGDRLKIWPVEGGADVAPVFARDLQGNVPVFLFESLAKEIETKKDKSVVDVINDGGTIGWVIVGLGLVGVLLMVLRVFFLQKSSASTSKLSDKAGDMVAQGKTDDALAYCKKKNSAPARVVAAAIRNMDRDRDHVEDIVSEAILHESSFLNRFGTFIMVIAAVAPLLGLLGTVTGMIDTFEIITQFGTGDPARLSGGIAIALVTTELGLIVAIPTLLIGNLLNGWAENIKDDMEKVALRVINVAQAKRERMQAAA